MEIVKDKLMVHCVDVDYNHLEIWKVRELSDQYFLRIFNENRFTEFLITKNEFKELLEKLWIKWKVIEVEKGEWEQNNIIHCPDLKCRGMLLENIFCYEYKCSKGGV